MDLNYLVKEILPQRKKEIKEGDNDATRHAIYVVIDLDERFMEDTLIGGYPTNLKDKPAVYGFFDNGRLKLDPEDFVFNESSEGMLDPIRVIKYYSDRIVAFFLTKKAAREYLEYQKHNLENPYIYTFNAGYRNRQMEQLLGKW